MLNIKLKMQPPTVTAQEHKVGVRNGKPFFYDPPELKAARDKLISHLLPYTKLVPFHEPVVLQTRWLFQSDAHRTGEWKATKPDTDNLQKLLKDCMTYVGFWDDDALVVRETVEKRWVDMDHMPGIQITIWTAAEWDDMENTFRE